jgi:hypothetical protein
VSVGFAGVKGVEFEAFPHPVDQLPDGFKNIWVADVARIWKDPSWLVRLPDARMSKDPVVSDPAHQLPENFAVADLSAIEIGSGFNWGKADPRAEFRCARAELVFGVEEKLHGLLSRVFFGH